MMQETKDVLILVARVANGVSKSVEDGTITAGDALHFWPAAMAIPAAIAKCTDIPAEIMAATEADKEDLLDTFCKEFSISSAAAEEMIENVLTVVVAFWKLLKTKTA